MTPPPSVVIPYEEGRLFNRCDGAIQMELNLDGISSLLWERMSLLSHNLL